MGNMYNRTAHLGHAHVYKTKKYNHNSTLCLLDIYAFPSSVKIRVPHANPLPAPTNIFTATGMIQSKDKFNVHNNIATVPSLDLDELYVTYLPENIISVSNYFRAGVPLVITKHGAYDMGQKFSSTLNLKNKIAT